MYFLTKKGRGEVIIGVLHLSKDNFTFTFEAVSPGMMEKIRVSRKDHRTSASELTYFLKKRRGRWVIWYEYM